MIIQNKEINIEAITKLHSFHWERNDPYSEIVFEYESGRIDKLITRKENELKDFLVLGNRLFQDKTDL